MVSVSPDRQKFRLGQVLQTPGSLSVLNPEDVYDGLSRHTRGDWGDCCQENAGANDAALQRGGRLFSVYHDRNETKFYIFTEADRSATTVLLPDEY